MQLKNSVLTFQRQCGRIVRLCDYRYKGIVTIVATIEGPTTC